MCSLIWNLAQDPDIAVLTSSTIGGIRRQIESLLQDMAGNTAKLEARILLEHVLGLDRAQMISRDRDPLQQSQSDQLEELIARRLKGEPVFRILGEREFYGRVFKLNEATLEPRADTETLIDAVLKHKDRFPVGCKFLDLGTGTGCIAITLLAEMKSWLGTASDISERALEAVGVNAANHGVDARLSVVASDVFENVDGQFDFIVSNPPYIPSCDLNELDVEVRDHDPKRALDGGTDGMVFYEALFSRAAGLLGNNGMMFLEFGQGQTESLRALANRLDWQIIEVHRDLSGIERALVSQKCP